jgi:ectoine hydroxylase-related dioxygenase (phytanoyl-CoA dioxygenase family)
MAPDPIPRLLISDEELRKGTTSSATIQLALKQFHKDGFVIIENAIDHESIDRLRTRMERDVQTNLCLPQVSYNHGLEAGNVSQTPPLQREYITEQLYANRHAIAILENIIGPRPQLSWVGSNIVLPQSHGRQAVHTDFYAQHLDFPTGVEVYTYLDHCSGINGSTEIWPGTHIGYNIDDHIAIDSSWIKQEVFSARAAVQPPVQLNVPKGSICIRDLRMWHAGMPNYTDHPRIMFGLVYFPRWYGAHMRLVLPLDVKEAVESWTHVDIASHTDFVDNLVDYLHLQKNINFEQKPVSQTDDMTWRTRHSSLKVATENYWMPP